MRTVWGSRGVSWGPVRMKDLETKILINQHRFITFFYLFLLSIVLAPVSIASLQTVSHFTEYMLFSGIFFPYCIYFISRCYAHPVSVCMSSSGSLVVESVPDHQLGAFHHQLIHTGQGPSGSPRSHALGAPRSTLAQLQMQVDKLNPQAQWQPQPSPPPWTWYQSIQLQRTFPRPLQRGSPSHSLPPKPDQRFTRPLHNRVSPTRILLSPGLSPQVTVRFFVLVCMCACVSLTDRPS